MSIIQPTPLPESGDLTYTPYFRGCVMTPASVQVTCCAALGSTAAQINGTLGCPYTSTFADTDANKSAWLACCKTNGCDAELCTEGGLDAPYPSSTSASDTDTDAEAPTGSATPTGKPNSGLSMTMTTRRHFWAALAWLLMAQTLVSLLPTSL